MPLVRWNVFQQVRVFVQRDEVAATLLLEMVPRRGKVWRPTSVSGIASWTTGPAKVTKVARRMLPPDVCESIQGQVSLTIPWRAKLWMKQSQDTGPSDAAARRASLQQSVGDAGGLSLPALPGQIVNAETTDPAFRSRSSSPTATPVSAVSKGATSLEGPEGAGSKVDATWYSTFRGRRPAELDLDEATESEPSLPGEPTFFRRRAVSDELPQIKRAMAASTDLPRRHSDVSSVSSVSSNVAQKIAVYEAFRKVCSPRSSSNISSSSDTMPAMPRGGEAEAGAEKALASSCRGTTTCSSPEERSKEWIVERLVEAGALPLQEAAERFGDTESSEASSRLIGSPEMLKQLEEQLKDQSSKFQLQSEERQRLELQLQQQKEALQRLEGKQVGEVPKVNMAAPVQNEEKDEKKEPEKKEPEKKEPEKAPKGTKGKGGKAKGKGGTTPPCKGKGKAASEEPRMPEVTPKTAMKKLFWNPLKLGETTSIWEHIWCQRADLALFDVEVLEASFAEAGGTSPLKRPSLAPALATRKKRRALEEKRRRELWFMLALMPEKGQLLQAIQEMNDDVLKPEKVELLHMNLPTAADIEVIHTSLMNEPLLEGELWDTPEDFVLAISELPNCATRELWKAANALLKSESLERLLGLLLFVGNYLNGGTARGRADGFDLEALPKVAKLRGKGHESLLDFLVSQAESSRKGLVASLFQADGEAEAVRRARMHCVKDAVEETKTLISQAEGFLPQQVESEAMEKRKEKLEESLKKLRDVLQKFHEWETKYEELCHWFQMQDGRQRTCEDFFGLWESFLTDLKKSWESHRREQLAKESSRRSLSLPPRRRSVPVLTTGSKTPSASPRARRDRRRTAHGMPSDFHRGLENDTGEGSAVPAPSPTEMVGAGGCLPNGNETVDDKC